MHELIFEPYRDRVDARDLPAPEDERAARSVGEFRRFVDGGRITLGQMTYCLINVGCDLSDGSHNAFVRYLRERLISVDDFCGRDRWPWRLRELNDRFRNRAAHLDRLTLEGGVSARALLLEEPTRLLITLLRQLRSHCA